MKRNLFFSFALAFFGLGAGTAFCATPDWLVLSMKNGESVTVNAAGVEMHYANGALVLSSPVVQQSLDVDNLVSMRFTDLASHVEMSVGHDSTTYEVVDIQGQSYGNYTSIAEMRDVLPGGIYIVKVCTQYGAKSGSSTFKVIL